MVTTIMKNLLETYNNNGYFIQTNFFDQEFIESLLKDIEIAKNKKDADIYLDRNGLPRRIERLYDKSENLKLLNLKISEFLEKVFKKSFLIFKDKFNSKPPGGEGYQAHYDGVFKFIDKDNVKKNGWYEYSDYFVNVLVSLDKSDDNNGTLQISNVHKKNFDELLSKTLRDGSPNLDPKFEKSLKFESINLNVGDILIFDNRCPHRSNKNKSNNMRRILYYTYSLSSAGSQYKKYFSDKESSKNVSSKSLIGDA